MKWKIDYYSDKVAQEVLALPEKLLARYLRMTEVMCEAGANLGMPHTRSLGEGLLELRVKAKEGIARVFYCAMVSERIVILHCFIKKTQKIPRKELDLAKARLKEIKNA